MAHTHTRVAFDDDLHQPRERIFEGIEGNTVITISVKYEFAYNGTGKCELKICRTVNGKRDEDANLHKISKYRVTPTERDAAVLMNFRLRVKRNYFFFLMESYVVSIRKGIADFRAIIIGLRILKRCKFCSLPSF